VTAIIHALDGAYAVSVTPDGTQLYAAGYIGDDVSHFTIAGLTLSLTARNRRARDVRARPASPGQCPSSGRSRLRTSLSEPAGG
jgi:hypothetical protein